MKIERTFEIGDIVELVDKYFPARVTGVIHDDERLFVDIGEPKEVEVHFNDVVEQYRKIGQGGKI